MAGSPGFLADPGILIAVFGSVLLFGLAVHILQCYGYEVVCCCRKKQRERQVQEETQYAQLSEPIN